MLAQPVHLPIFAPIAQAVQRVLGAGFNPATLFSDGSKGVLYDNNDLTAFYLDSAMTTQATVNGLVGAQADKSGNGRHRTQTTTGSKPVLRGTPTGGNLFASYGTPGSGWADSGSGVATATATTGSIPTNVVPANTRVYRVRYTATVTSGTVRLTMGGVNGATRSASGTYEEYIAATSTAALSFQGVTAFTGTVSAIDARDVTADSVTAPYGLHYDGFDDFLVTAAVDFSATDKMGVCMGVRSFTTASSGIMLELSANASSTAGSFGLAVDTASGNPYFARGFGTAAGSLFENTATVPRSAVFSVAFDISQATIATEITLRVNGAAPASTPVAGPLGTGNFGNYALYFGRRGGTSLPLNGLDYGGIIVGKALTAAQLASVERWTAQRTGVTI